MKREIHLFFTALMFYTRIPCPKNIDHNPDDLNKATRYFPLIGWIVGTVSFIAYYAVSLFLETETAVILGIIAGILTTGAFHEDGFADVCDGFGGGWTKERILLIMKDSAIGAYGAIGILLLLVLKFKVISEMIAESSMLILNSPFAIFLLFVTAHSVSRFAGITIIFTYSYSRDDETSKSKPIAKTYAWQEVAGSLFFGLLPLVIMSFFQWQIVLVLIPVFLTRFFMARYFYKWIDGYTGDCLGAAQQVCEVVFYISILALWKFI